MSGAVRLSSRFNLEFLNGNLEGVETGFAGEIGIALRRQFMECFFDLNERQVPLLPVAVFLQRFLAGFLYASTEPSSARKVFVLDVLQAHTSGGTLFEVVLGRLTLIAMAAGALCH